MGIFNEDDDIEDFGQQVDDDGIIVLDKKEVSSSLSETKDSKSDDNAKKPDEDSASDLNKEIEFHRLENQETKEKSSRRKTIVNITDVQDMLLAVDEIIYAFDYSYIQYKDEIRDKKKITKSLENASTRLAGYITEINSISENSTNTAKTLERVIDDFQNDVQDMITSIDFAPMQKAILGNINNIIKNIPLNQLNEGTGTLITGLQRFSEVQKVFFEDIKGAETRLYEVRKIIKDALDEVDDVARKIFKRDKGFPWGIFLGALSVGTIIGSVGSIFLYQEFFGNKIDDIGERLEKKIINLSLSSPGLIKVGSDGLKYIDFDKSKTRFVIKKNSNNIRVYLK